MADRGEELGASNAPRSHGVVHSRDRLTRVLVVLDEPDRATLSEMPAAGYLLVACDDVSTLERAAVQQHVEAVLLDADRPGSIEAVGRLRRADTALSTVPVLFVGTPGVALRSGFDAVDVGGDAFLPRPLRLDEVTLRLRALLELPSDAAMQSVPPPALPTVPSIAAIAPLGAMPMGPAQRPSSASAAPRGSAGVAVRAALERDEGGVVAGVAAGVPRTSTVPPAGPSSIPSPPPLGSLTTATGLSASLADVLRSAALRAGAGDVDLALPALEEEALDDLLPVELLEPLDAPLDAWGDDPSGAYTPTPHFGYATWMNNASGGASAPGGRRAGGRSFSAGGALRGSPPTPTITPLAIAGESRLTGALGPYGVGALFGAASRARASGLLVLRAGRDEYALALTSGHVLSVRSSRQGDETGALLARLGAIPREAARFAAVPLDAGLRGAAMLSARGYLAPAALSQALSSAAREMICDLLALPSCEWEMRPLETAEEIPLQPRALDALVVLGARARVEPEDARGALGGDEATVQARVDPTVLAALPLLASERAAIETAAGQRVGELALARGAAVLPAVLALAWLGMVRVEGGTGAVAQAPASTLALERSRIRALLEAAESRDFFALLGVSPWSSGAAARDALSARSAEVAGLCARHPEVRTLPSVVAVLEEIARMLDTPEAWSRYAAALREGPTNM